MRGMSGVCGTCSAAEWLDAVPCSDLLRHADAMSQLRRGRSRCPRVSVLAAGRTQAAPNHELDISASLQLLVPADAHGVPSRATSGTTAAEAPVTSAVPAPVAAFQIDAEATRLDILPPGMAVPDTAPDEVVFQADTDPDVAQALAALEKLMKDVPDSVATAVTRAIQLGRTSRTTYADLAGVDIIAKELRKVVTMPLVHPDFFSSYGLEPPRGVLMHGPPGSGKTRLACAAAAEAGASLLVRHWSRVPCTMRVRI